MFLKNFETLGEKKNNNRELTKIAHDELQASINGKKSINVVLFASFRLFLIIYNNCN